MFEDRQRELQRIQEQLLEDDVPETDEVMLDEIEELIGDVQNGYEPDGFYNSDGTDITPEELSDELLAPKEDLRGLIIAACLLTTAIVLLLGWWVVRLLG